LAVEALADKGFEVRAGVTPYYAGSIAVMSAEPHIVQFCPKDPTEKRFATKESMEAWLQKGDDSLGEYGRGMFLLVRKVGEGGLRLAGYGWTGPESSTRVPRGTTTFAVRIGVEGQGKGLAKPFTQLIVDGTATLFNARDIWLETWQGNHAAKVYRDVGFEYVTEAYDQKAMATRVYMSYPNELLPAA